MNNDWDCREVKNCIACGSMALEPVIDLGYQALANAYTKTNVGPQQEFPLALNRCTHCFHLQLTHQVNPELMFKDYAYVSGTAQTMLKFFDWLAGEIVLKYGKTPKNVLDIGCNDGSFLNSWGGTGVKTYGVDPAENLHKISSVNHNVHCGFYTGDEFGNTTFDIITCLNAFAHNADQLTLLNNIKRRMNDDSLLFCSVSQVDMIQNGEFDTIYHEHLSFYCIKSARALCDRAGLNLIDVIKHPIHGGSYIFVMSKTQRNEQKIQNLIDDEAVIGLYDPKTYKTYAEKAYHVAEMFANTIRTYRKNGYKIIGYGAPAKGTVMMNFANEKPDVIFEDTPFKQNTYSPGIACHIIKPEWNFDNDDKVLWIPLAWNFYKEITDKIRKNKSGGSKHEILKYFPTFEIENV